jgi:putative transcriptional regulator
VNKKLLGELVESMTQMGAIVRGERKPSREFHVDSETSAK